MRNETNETRTTFRVPESNLETLKFRIAKLAKRAAKLNVAPPTVVVGACETFKSTHKGITKIRNYYTVEVKGAAPKLNGWEFVAVLQEVSDENGDSLGNILRNVPGCEHNIPESYRAAESRCEHCGTIRRRNETFVLRSEAGLWKQVGRNCLRDFLGHVSPEAYATWAEMLIDASDLGGLAEDEGWSDGGRIIERFAIEEVLAVAACCVRLNGWTSKKTAELGNSIATASIVDEWIRGNSETREAFVNKLEPSDADKATAAEVVEWLASLADRDTSGNDYLYNLSLLGKGATFTTKNFGLACSAIPTHAKEVEREINRKKKFEADLNSQFVGTVGSRARLDNLTLVFTTNFDGQYGVTHFYKFKDAAGNVIVWSYSSDKGFKAEDIVTLEAMVVEHKEREGVKQTKINRAKTPKRDK